MVLEFSLVQEDEGKTSEEDAPTPTAKASPAVKVKAEAAVAPAAKRSKTRCVVVSFISWPVPRHSPALVMLLLLLSSHTFRRFIFSDTLFFLCTPPRTLAGPPLRMPTEEANRQMVEAAT